MVSYMIAALIWIGVLFVALGITSVWGVSTWKRASDEANSTINDRNAPNRGSRGPIEELNAIRQKSTEKRLQIAMHRAIARSGDTRLRHLDVRHRDQGRASGARFRCARFLGGRETEKLERDFLLREPPIAPVPQA